MEMCYDGALVMPSSYAVMDAEDMIYVEGGGFQELAIELLWHACKSIFGEVAKKAFFAAVPKIPGLLCAMKSAIVALPWSRITAIAILGGIAASYGYMLYRICKK